MPEPNALTNIERIEGRIDRVVASSVPVSDNIGGVAFENMGQLLEFAKLVSVSRNAIPPHLRENPGACLAVTIQALEWRFSPFAVANKSYEVNGRIAYESQLVHAVIEARAPLKTRLRCTYEGEGDDMVCVVTGHFRGEPDPVSYRSPPFGKINPKNSPLWRSDPQQQLWYFASRAWCRRYAPDVLMGVFSKDELEDNPPLDLEPSKPTVGERLKGGKGKRGFSHAHVEKQLAPPEQPDAAPEASTEPQAAADDAAPPPATEPASEAPEPPDDAHEETPMERGQRLLVLLKKPADIDDLQASIADELDGDDLADWNDLCKARRAAVAKGAKP